MEHTHGYVTDVGYPAFFHRQMLPAWLSASGRFLGRCTPDASARFSFLELGCGIGVNLLVAAASHPQASFVGVDFNRAHLALAREGAVAAGLDNVRFVEADFSAFATANRERFDYVASHGVWSWVAPEQRAALMDCVAGALAPGGLFYLHYMCHPGSTDLVPVQHLLAMLARHLEGNSSERAQAAVRLLLQLGEAGAFVEQPRVLDKIRALATKDPAHLAHEFLTDHWEPQHAARVHAQVGGRGLLLLGSAGLFDNLDPSISIPGRLQPALARVRAPMLADALRDMARNSHQRQDLFQMPGGGAGPAGPAPLRLGLLPGARIAGKVSVQTPIGMVHGPEALTRPVLECLAAGPATFQDLARLPVFAGDPQLAAQTVQLLMYGGLLHPQPDTAVPAAATAALQQWFRRRGIGLQLVPACATALMPAAAG